MRSLKVALFAGAAFAAAFTSANAADLGPIMQAPRTIAPVQVEELTGGWYLRGDIGVGVQGFKDFDFTPDQPGIRVAGELAHRSARDRRCRRSSAAASASSGIRGCASM